MYPTLEERRLFVGVSLKPYGDSLQPPDRADVAQQVTMSNGEIRFVVYVYVEAVSVEFLRTLARMVVENKINFDWRKADTHVAV